MRYLGLIGLGCTVAFPAVAMLAVFGTMTLGGDVVAPPRSLGVAIGLVVAIPLPFLAVLVPAGIYRSLAGTTPSAEIFS